MLSIASVAIVPVSQASYVWQKPVPGRWKLNVDGAVSSLCAEAGCGGVLRDDSGQWLAGFLKKLGICDALNSELWAMAEGLSLAWDLGIRKVMLESDAASAVDLIKRSPSHSGNLLVLKIKDILR
ncbi:hypothetical protein QN277_000008 [Acacia crassicarpa]|uniref:RNase H type-1 domain-containing protein n=1 Tax=Acacia crassicarpa TaxID=499986 RepID=A0AAE1N567_9FABA|nr:hypothetical protein QN277_000008 [Acacia crassicarpa]